MDIGGRHVSAGSPVFVIAEIGNNHDGSIRQAERLIDAAAEAGADAVKFQTHIAEAEMLPSTPTPPHFDEPRYAFTQRMELSLDDHRRLKAFAEERGVVFFSSPFSVEAVELLEEVGVGLYKIASGEVTNPPLLEAVAATGKPVLLSSGMSGLDEVERALALLRAGGSEVLVLQCTSTYPCPPEQVNLRAMVAIGERLGVPVGLSDHTPDVWTSVAAVALGAAAIEKHFTLSKRLYGPDHHASLEPEELRRLVEGIRQVEAALGSGVKQRDPAHDAVRATFEKSVVARIPIAAGAPRARSRRTRCSRRRTLPERRRVCVVVASRANYARVRTVLEAVRDHPALELQIVAGASMVLQRFGNAVDVMAADGFRPDATIRFIIEGETPATMAKSTGLGLLELPTVFELLRPDVVVTVADRFETIATAIAAAYMNIPVAHTQGGEVSGSIDESVRHAVTKLAHLHFPATDLSARRVIAMGEDPATVFNAGCPSIDLVARTPLGTRAEALAQFGGVGAPIDPEAPFVLVIQHPVTTEYGHGLEQVTATVRAVAEIGVQALVFWPNVDAGSEDVAKGLRLFREAGEANGFHFFRNLPPETFVRLMAHTSCMVGNSSAALREGAFLGTPAVTVGTRRQGRERGPNVVEVGYEQAEIADAIRDQVAHGPYERSLLFGDGTAGAQIADVLAAERPQVQKRLVLDLPAAVEAR